MAQNIRIRNNFIIFVVNAGAMALELVASRIMSPYFGASNDIWTAVIAVILCMGSVGNLIGGRMKSRKETAGVLLIVFSLWTAMIPLICDPLLEALRIIVRNNRIGALIGAVILFSGSSAACGMFTPILLAEEVNGSDDVKPVSGEYYAVMTAGGLLGTFLGGYVFAPLLGARASAWAIAIFCAGLAVIVLKERFRLGAMAVCFIMIVTAWQSGKTKSTIVYEYDSEYSHIEIYDTKDMDGNDVRVLNMGDTQGHMSACLTDPKRRNELRTEYLRVYDEVVTGKEGDKNILLLGGGGYSYPKWILASSMHKEDRIDVAELDQAVSNAAMKYFWLEDAIRDFDPKGERFRNFIGDGRMYLENAEDQYDVILNDTFAGGGTPAATLTTKEFMELAYKALLEDGILAVNVIGALKGKTSSFLLAEYRTMRAVFPVVYLLRVTDAKDTERTNWILVGKKTGTIPDNGLTISDLSDHILLTDDYCPVEYLFGH